MVAMESIFCEWPLIKPVLLLSWGLADGVVSFNAITVRHWVKQPWMGALLITCNIRLRRHKIL